MKVVEADKNRQQGGAANTQGLNNAFDRSKYSKLSVCLKYPDIGAYGGTQKVRKIPAIIKII
ncbi:hypothetical protein MIH18_09295 [Marinobacter sp. M3C]|uniref:hypothetical protein n=1 Tax=unclassified Marinobacter TaxID=83889 RepID=UPI00200F1174|nr:MULTISPECIES: hypothetical protein [unclassified Marinobacter]MCL1483643.1 hypothetical protein [Marinobacter sp.]UQG56711.1 hypothetical protein MIH16_03295 [Marinobacter sp. M4C]UQG62087.1 hypothetical protein MIH18_09295 [Marinobacter sp. M3C]UQG65515.1 hypothetical protein MIH17_03295 [Marinobacter sp. M2C]UQG69795.1 hypothetical protein MIH19_03290 [Marinobacter sp. M1C]